MSKDNGHGGARQGAGRKPKADEVALVEKLSPLDETAFNVLRTGLEMGEFPFLKLFMEYRFGKPRETKDIDVTSNGESFDLRELVKFK